jgi:hypothetical protein
MADVGNEVVSGPWAGAKGFAKTWFERRGFRIARVDPAELMWPEAGFDATVPLPPGARETLRRDHPRLIELEARYRAFESPLSRHTLWDDGYRNQKLDLAYFRGDNVYVWQVRTLGEHARLKYFLQGQYVRGFDTRGLFDRLIEDGQFGCWTFRYAGLPRLSRDLLDSINELYFLDRELDLFARTSLTVLDIGAGYGRLAHRMCEALPGLTKYYCVDAVPESTFLSEYYLGYRGCQEKAIVVPLDEIASVLPAEGIDLAVNIHGFSEVGLDVIGGWLDELARRSVPWLLIVPNDYEQLLSFEGDGSRLDYMPLLEARGYRLRCIEPCIRDPDVRELSGVRPDHFLLFERTGGRSG